MNKHNLICGVLYTSSTTVHGITKNGTIKQFIAYKKVNDKKIFYVKTKKDHETRDYYVIIKPSEETLNGETVYSVHEYIGYVGDKSAEFDYLKKVCTIKWNSDSMFNIKDYTQDLVKDRIDLTHIDNIYSIDPDKCTDIDDAIHVIHNNNNNNIQIGIHIADVSSYIPIDSPLDKEIRNRCESIYLSLDHDKQLHVPMLPKQLVQQCSLTSKVKKRCFSVLINLNMNKIISTEFVRSTIIVKENLSYNDAENLVNNELKLMYNIGKLFINDENYDTHKMVESYMILANCLVAEKLPPKEALLRSHKGQQNIIINNDINPELVKYANLLMTEAAEYCIGISDESTHVGLNKKIYTHFTSPIRRFCDVIVHRMLFDTYKTDDETVDHINLMHKKYNICERKSVIIYKLFNLVNKNNIIQVIGHIVNIDIINHKIRILIDTDILKKFDVEARIIDKKLDHLVKYEYEDNKMIVYNDNHLVEFKLFDQIIIKLCLVLKNKKKIITQIIDPDITKLFASTNDKICL